MFVKKIYFSEINFKRPLSPTSISIWLILGGVKCIYLVGSAPPVLIVDAY